MDRTDGSQRATPGTLGAGGWAFFGTLTLASALGDPGGLLAMPVLFALKDDLGLGPQGLAVFEALLFVPVYLGFAFGFLRDRWRPFGQGDRGYLWIGALIALVAYVQLASGSVAYLPLLGALFLAMVGYQLLDVASEALLTTVAQRYLMTGRLSALAEVTEAMPTVLAFLAGGWMAAHTDLGIPVLAAGACTLAILALAVWYPRHLVHDERTGAASGETHRAALARLLRHRPLAVAAAVGGVWNLSLAWGTPFLFFVSDDLGLSSEWLGLCRAVGVACALVAAPLYGVVCRRLALGRTLRVAVVLGLAPGFLYLLVTGPWQAVAVSALAGVPTAFGYMALFDLLRRSCPRDLEGSGMAVLHSALALSVGAGDVAGAWLYTHAGFAWCLLADALANASVLFLLSVLPPTLVSWRDGEDAAMAQAA